MICNSRNLHRGSTVSADKSTRPSPICSGLHPIWGTSQDKPTGNTKGVKKMRKIRKITRDKKGIDTILAALLMVVIVVVAAVMVYAWSTGLLSALLVQNPVPKESLNDETVSYLSNNTM